MQWNPWRLIRAWRRPGLAAQPVGDEGFVAGILAAAAELHSLSSAALRQRADELRASVSSARPLTPAFLSEAFALTSEALRRGVGCQPYESQLLAGLVMARGRIAEMATGEGKTLAAAFPAAALALSGRRVHVATPNAYLAQRDYEQLGPPLALLGVEVALLPENAHQEAKRNAYGAQVIYGTGYEFGFDYLRDQLQALQELRRPLGEQSRRLLSGSRRSQSGPLQGPLDCALIDEIDSVLIDEACLPLVLSEAHGQGDGNDLFLAADLAAGQLRPGLDYELSLSSKRLQLTAGGHARIHAKDHSPPIVPLRRPWATYVEQALYARHFLHRDADYTVHDGRILLVDQHTGRVFTQRTYRDGLQQAIEAKERLTISPEQGAAARISRQRFYRQYRFLSGMTGTAYGVEKEFQEVYGLSATAIALRRPSRRTVLAPRFFATAADRWQAIVSDAVEIAPSGRPLLVGTRTIADSQQLSALLAGRGLVHQLLNGRQDQSEAAIVAQAGHRGAITIATNMAGRGTDIRLAPGVADLGGLHVIVAEPQLSQRVERQLMGRAARQGDPGTCRLYVSAEDELLARFGPHVAQGMSEARLPHGEAPGEWLSQVLAVQRRAEQHAAAQRRKMMASDKWLEEMLAALSGRPSGGTA